MTLSRYLEQYKKWLEFKGIATSTIKSYLKLIRLFIKHAGNLDTSQVKRQHLINWSLEVKKRASDNYSINCLWAMRSFLKFLKEEKDLKVWHFQNLIIPKRRIPEYIEYLKNKEIKKLFDSIPTDEIHSLRLRVLLEVLLNMGLRPSEALSLNRNVADNDELEIIGKGNKKRKIYLNERVKKWINTYLKVRLDDHPALFVSHCKPKRLSLRRAEEHFQEYWKKIANGKRVTLHTMRHTYGTNLLMNGCPSEYIQKLLGHSKLETTELYYLSVIQKHTEQAHYKYLNYEK